MPKYSEQDLKLAAEFREEIHREALAIVRKTLPCVTEVIDRHPVEDYFQEHWDYPGMWYTVVAVPYGYKSRKALVDRIVRDTLDGKAPEKESADKKDSRDETAEQVAERPSDEPDADPFYSLIEEYPDLSVDYRIVKNEPYTGYGSHRQALKTAYRRLGGKWSGDPDRAEGRMIASETMFSSDYKDGKLNYRKAFLYPPHQSGCNGKDFAHVNAVLFPNGTEDLEVYEWSTDWSDYFDDGHEWWGALCLTVYDRSLDRFVVITASATD